MAGLSETDANAESRVVPAAEVPEIAVPEASESDWSEALASAGGDRELMKSVMKVFLGEQPQLMAAIRRAVDAGDRSALRLAAHTLKGSLRYLGKSLAFDLAFRLETMAQSGDLAQAVETLAALDEKMEQLTKTLRDYLHGEAAV